MPQHCLVLFLRNFFFLAMTATGAVTDPATTEMADSPIHAGAAAKPPEIMEDISLESPRHDSPVQEGGLGDSIVEGSVVEPPAPVSSPLDDITSLFISARYGEFPSILSKLSEEPSKWDLVISARDNEGHSILHWAALFDSADFVKASCKKVPEVSAWVNHRSNNGQTAVMWCCIKGNIRTLKVLYKDFEAKINLFDSLKADAVILATQHHQHNTLLLLQRWGGRLSLASTDVSGCTAAHWAAYKGDVMMLRLLAYFNVDMNAIDGQGMTPLHRAVGEGQNECALFLVEKCGADVNFMNSKDECAMDIAKRLDNKMLLFALSEATAKKDYGISTSSETPLGSHWGLPIVFVMCMSITILTYLSYLVKSGSFVANVVFGIFVILSISLYVNLLFSDPGFVPKRKPGQSAVEELQEKLEEESSDGGMILYKEKDLGMNKICFTCWEHKELERRMKHCSVCDRCVDAFDHHCGWINNCVAEKNHRRFVLMVTCVLLGMIVFSIRSVNFAFDSQMPFFDLLWTKPLLVPAWIIHLMVVPWLAILCFMQLRSIALNLNTNEMINMHRYSHFWEDAVSSQPAQDPCGTHKHGGSCSHSSKPPGKIFKNPFDQGGFVENCKYFWFSKGKGRNRYATVSTRDVELAKMV